MNKWNKLSMTDRAAYIKLGIDNGITDLAIIRDTYNKFAEGGYVREQNNNPIAFDEEGNLVDQVTGEKGTMMLPNFNVYGHKDVADFVQQKRLSNLINHSEINPFTGETRVIGLERTYPEFEILGFADFGKNLLSGIKKTTDNIIDIANRANWKGDAVKLTKDRLNNGGFSRLEKAHNSVLSKTADTNPVLKSDDAPLTYTPKRKMELLDTEVYEVPSLARTGNPNHIGVSNSEMGPVIYSDRPSIYRGKQATSDISAHEFSHYVYTPGKTIPKEDFMPVKGYSKYFNGFNSTEVQARGTQIKNYFGLTEGEPLTAEHLKYAAEHFVKDRGYDNGMTEFFKSIKNWDNVAKWLNDNSPAVLPIGLTIGGATYLNQRNKNK